MMINETIVTTSKLQYYKGYEQQEKQIMKLTVVNSNK